MSEEAALYFAADAALAEQREEMRFSGGRDAAGLQAWLKRLFGAAGEETRAATSPEAPASLASERGRREMEARVQAMLELEAAAAAG